MKNENIRNKALNGFIWKFSEKVGTQLLQIVLQIILARILLPSDYGLIAILSIFITISDVFITQGFSTGIIQKKVVDDLDCSSIFWANLLLSFILYLILFLISPYVAKFYKNELLTKIMRVLSLNVIIGAIGSVHNAVLSRKLDFKKSFYRNLSNIITQGIVGIILAYKGYGVWSLVFSKLSGSLVGSLVLCLTVEWRPKFVFSLERVTNLFYFSSRILGTNILNTFFNNVHTVIIGKYYTNDILGYYQRGQQIPQASMTAVDGSMNEVLYATLSKYQDDIPNLKRILRKSMKLSMYVVMPLMFGLISIAKPLTIFLLTEKWIHSVPFMQLSCIICMFWPLTARIHGLNALGRSDVTLKIEIISKLLTLALILVLVPFGIYAIMYGTIIASCISLWIVSFYVNKYIGYTNKEMFRDLLPTFISSIIMMICVLFAGKFVQNIFLKLVVEILIGITVYGFLSDFFKIDSFFYLKDIILKKLF